MPRGVSRKHVGVHDHEPLADQSLEKLEADRCWILLYAAPVMSKRMYRSRPEIWAMSG